jgi:hypothetical protein
MWLKIIFKPKFICFFLPLFLYTLHAFYDFPICILCFIKVCLGLFSYNLEAHSYLLHTSIVCVTHSVFRSFSHYHCVCFCFSSMCILFCSLRKGQLPISAPLLMHLSFQIHSPVSVVHTITVCTQIPHIPPPLLFYMMKEFELKKKIWYILSNSLSSGHCNCIVWVTASLDKIHIEGEAYQWVQFWQGFLNKNDITIDNSRDIFTWHLLGHQNQHNVCIFKRMSCGVSSLT